MASAAPPSSAAGPPGSTAEPGGPSGAAAGNSGSTSSTSVVAPRLSTDRCCLTSFPTPRYQGRGLLSQLAGRPPSPEENPEDGDGPQQPPHWTEHDGSAPGPTALVAAALPQQHHHQQYWMPDSACRSCTKCGKVFTVFRRRHHCRLCGKIFCNNCSSNFADGSAYGQESRMRLCDDCSEFEETNRRKEGTAVTVLQISATRAGALDQPNAKLDAAAATAPMPIPTRQMQGTTAHASASGHTPPNTSGTPNGGVAPIHVMAAAPGAADMLMRAARSRLGRIAFDALPSVPADKSVFEALQARAAEHLERALEQAVNSAPALCRNDAWKNTILALGRRAVLSVRPAVELGDKMDIRSYVKVKTIAGGSVQECEYVTGVVFRKNLAHKAMRQDIMSPRVLILNDAIEFERASGRMSSLETIQEQEIRYTQILVDKIMRLKPDLLIVGKSVSRVAQEALLHHNVSVVFNVKHRVLQRVSRLTGAAIVESINLLDKISEKAAIGTCGQFKMRWIQLPDGEDGGLPERLGRRANWQAFVVLRQCPEHLGCTLVLRGERKSVLKQAKALLLWVVFVAWNLRLEVSFLFDEGATVPKRPLRAVFARTTEGLMNTMTQPNEPIDRSAASTPAALSLPHALQQTAKNNALLQQLQDSAIIPSSPDVAYRGGPGTAGASSKADESSTTVPAVSLSLMHQNILVGVCLLHDGRQCIDAEIKRIRFYSKTDLTLGQFLVDQCFNKSAVCIACKQPYWDHVVAYAHNRGRVEIHVHRTPHSLPPATSRGARSAPDYEKPGTSAKAAAASEPSEAFDMSHPLEVADAEDIVVVQDGATAPDTGSLPASPALGATPVLQSTLSRVSAGSSTSQLPASASYGTSPQGVVPLSLASSSPVDSGEESTSSNTPALADLKTVLSLDQMSAATRSVYEKYHRIVKPPLPSRLPPDANGDPNADAEAFANPDAILVWSSCSLCKRTITRPAPMSRAAWCMSFAKVLELTFYNHSVAANSSFCPHCPHTHLTRHFGQGKFIATFTYERIKPLTVRSVAKLAMDAAWAQRTRRHELAELAIVGEHLVGLQLAAIDTAETTLLETKGIIDERRKKRLNNLRDRVRQLLEQLKAFTQEVKPDAIQSASNRVAEQLRARPVAPTADSIESDSHGVLESKGDESPDRPSDPTVENVQPDGQPPTAPSGMLDLTEEPEVVAPEVGFIDVLAVQQLRRDFVMALKSVEQELSRLLQFSIKKPATSVNAPSRGLGLGRLLGQTLQPAIKESAGTFSDEDTDEEEEEDSDEHEWDDPTTRLRSATLTDHRPPPPPPPASLTPSISMAAAIPHSEHKPLRVDGDSVASSSPSTRELHATATTAVSLLSETSSLSVGGGAHPASEASSSTVATMEPVALGGSDTPAARPHSSSVGNAEDTANPPDRTPAARRHTVVHTPASAAELSARLAAATVEKPAVEPVDVQQSGRAVSTAVAPARPLEESKDRTKGSSTWLSRIFESRGGRNAVSQLDVGHPTLLPGYDGRVVFVYDDEPVTMVAHCLSTESYRLKLIECISELRARQDGRDVPGSALDSQVPQHPAPVAAAPQPVAQAPAAGSDVAAAPTSGAASGTATDALEPTQPTTPMLPEALTLDIENQDDEQVLLFGANQVVSVVSETTPSAQATTTSQLVLPEQRGRPRGRSFGEPSMVKSNSARERSGTSDPFNPSSGRRGVARSVSALSLTDMVGRLTDSDLTLADNLSLWAAVEAGRVDAVETELAVGADANGLNDKGLSALHMVCSSGKEDILALLLQQPTVNVDLPTQDAQGAPPLVIAAVHSNPGLIRRLLGAQASINLTNKMGETALIVAAKHGQISNVRLLLEAQADTFVRDAGGKSALDWAAELNFTDVATMLKAIAPATPPAPSPVPEPVPMLTPAMHAEQSLESQPEPVATMPEISPSEMLLIPGDTHIKQKITDLTPEAQLSFTCTVYFAAHFHALREAYVDSERSYVQSLAYSRTWAASGGKSGASFNITEDRRFVIKYVSRGEFLVFLSRALEYFQHMHKALYEGNYSILVKILGVYKLTATGPWTRQRGPRYIVVMENLFHGRNVLPHLTFDLKGKTRKAKQDTEDTVLLDTDLFTHTRGYPLPLTEPAKRAINLSVLCDTQFLSSIQVMDYSILMAVDEDSGELLIGIIDYIRRYNAAAEMEFLLKNFTQDEPTVVEPERYRDRLRRAMDKYFMTVPTKFTEVDEAAAATMMLTSRSNAALVSEPAVASSAVLLSTPAGAAPANGAAALLANATNTPALQNTSTNAGLVRVRGDSDDSTAQEAAAM